MDILTMMGEPKKHSNELWLKYLYNTHEINYNYNNIKMLNQNIVKLCKNKYINIEL